MKLAGQFWEKQFGFFKTTKQQVNSKKDIIMVKITGHKIHHFNHLKVYIMC